jgi:UDP-N-acetylglucosamine 2-epimerase (non-hydrolysing)
VDLMARSELILTDSGGIQEEACVLGKPTLVLRDTTERSEAIDAGTALLVGTDPDVIEREARAVLAGTRSLARLDNACPFGDGFAARKIVDVLKNQLSML